MRYLILTDIHGNWDALAAVLEHARQWEADRFLVLGDLVGYGGGPNEVVEAVRGLPLPAHVIRGNHDKVAAGLEDGANFNTVAHSAALWTSEQLTETNLAYVRELPRGPIQVGLDLTICHGSPLDEDEYLLSADQAQRNFAAHGVGLTFFGHTHMPTLFATTAEGVAMAVLDGDGVTIEVEEGRRYLVNPGSVGQPRDRDPRAAYMLYDDQRRRIQLYRVEYPLESAQQRILDAGLPQILAYRLAVGI